MTTKRTRRLVLRMIDTSRVERGRGRENGDGDGQAGKLKREESKFRGKNGMDEG